MRNRTLSAGAYRAMSRAHDRMAAKMMPRTVATAARVARNEASVQLALVNVQHSASLVKHAGATR